MFDENENIYPMKPELLSGNASRNRTGLILFAAVVLFLAINYLSSAYVLLVELIVVLAIHELGHLLMMRVYRVKAQGMFFMSIMGNLTKSFRFSDSQKEQTVINLMGPLPGVLLGTALFVIVINSEPNIYMIELALLFLGVNLLNLVPIDPFDGGRIVEGFFFYQNDQMKMIFTLASSLVMIGAGVIYSFIPLIIFGFLMGLKVRSFQKSKEVHDQLEETNINYKKEYKDLTNREYWKIRSAFLMNNPKLKEMIPSGYTLWENERLLMEQVRQVLRIDVKPDISLLGKISVIVLMVSLVVIPVLLVLSNYELIEWYLENASI